MTYVKPEIAVLGDASSLILSGTGAILESSAKDVAGTVSLEGDLDE